MFLTFETAYEIARLSTDQAVEEMEIPPDSISSVMVKIGASADPAQVAAQIGDAIPGVTPVESTNMFRSQRVQIMGLLQSMLVLLAVSWVLSVALVGLVFSIAVNERRREIGVLRALGFTRGYVLRLLLSEGLVLALVGGAAGIALFGFAVYLFHDMIVLMMGVPFVMPSPLSLLGLGLGALLLAMVSVAAGAVAPTLRISRMDPSLAMRK